MTLRLAWLIVAGTLLAAPASAAEVSASGPDDATAQDGAIDADAEAEVLSEAPAAGSAEDGVWAWVARMEGEIPEPEMVEAAEELREEHLAEAALIDQLGGGDVPTDFYSDPAKALQGDPLFLDLVDPSEFDIPIVVNDEVEKWVRYFTGSGRKYFERWLARATRYQPMMHAALDEAGLPRDLVYLSMIESGYNSHAYSSAHAVGLWQFIPSTGRLYDLRIDWWVDERRDPELSTKAAIAFLGELHKMFDGDWPLAWASYNGGPGRVRRAVSRAGTRDFWQLSAGTWLPSETDNYVPKIMAAAIIGKHPERYGFTDIAYKREFTFDTVYVEGMVELTVLAACAGLSEEDFKWFNPALRRWATPEGRSVVRVPKGAGSSFDVALAKVPAGDRLSFLRHKVARGETLSTIAAKYDVTVDDMVRVNSLRSADRIFVGMQLIVPLGEVSEAALAAAAEPSDEQPARPVAAAPTKAPAPTRTHVVKAGDTLSEVAVHYGVSVSDLQRWNNLSGSHIYVGQKLSLLEGAGGTAAGSVTYTVAGGDSLSRIAARYGVQVADLQRWNNIRNPSAIYVGQVLSIQASGESWTSYTVRSGDSLGGIGQRFGCTVSDLMAWNKLGSTVIHPGQALRVRR